MIFTSHKGRIVKMPTNNNHREFLFVRHCQTKWNAHKLCQGMQDIPLSDAGEKEALLLGKKLSKYNIDSILVSNLIRAKTTANIVANTIGITNVEVYDIIQERNFGRLEGLPNTMMYEFESLENKGLLPKIAYSNLEIETLEQFSNRVKQIINLITERLDTDNILIISHGRVFNMLCDILHAAKIKQLEHNEVVRFNFNERASSWHYQQEG